MRKYTRDLLEDTQGLSSVEYIIVIGLVAIVGLGAWHTFGQTLGNRLGMGESSSSP